MRHRSLLAAAVLLAALLPALPCLAEEPDLQGMLARVDAMASFDDTDFSCTYTAVSEKPGEEPAVFKLRLFRRDREDKFLILFLEPATQKGQGYLQIEDSLWFYDPESRRFSHSSFKENLQDSEAKGSDFRRSSLLEDYTVDSYEQGMLGKYDVWILDLKASNDEVSYPRLKMWLTKDRYLVLKVENYSLSDRLMRSAYYPSYVEVQGRTIPSRMLMVDELRPGEKTQVTIREASVAALPDSVFTKSYLERVNR